MFHDCQLLGIQIENIQVTADIHSIAGEVGFAMVAAYRCQGHVKH